MIYSRTRHGTSRRSLIAAGGLLATPAIVRAQGQNGVALVIGNSKYKWEASLPNVKRDAPDVAKRFQALGLKTELLQDAGQDAMRAAVDKFASAARGANLAAFYFAGHGASWNEDTYLVPDDADLGNPSSVQSLVSVRSIIGATREAQHRLLVFDSCRNNPADGWRQRDAVDSSKISGTELGVATSNGPKTLVLFSTAPGRVAVDGPAGQNSPFAAMFLRQLSASTVDLQALPTKLRRDILIATEGRQLLWDQNTFDQPFSLTNSSTNRPATSGSASPETSSQIVELPSAYAFAREKGLLLPPGLVALRPSSSSPDSSKIGSFKTTYKASIDSRHGNTTIEPMLFIVLSTSGSAAEVIFSTKDWYREGGKFWTYGMGNLEGPKIAVAVNRARGAEYPHTFVWKDANSGSYSVRVVTLIYSASFTRLD